MTKQSKRMQDNYKLVATDSIYKLEEAVELLKTTKPTKFDQTFNMSLRMGIDSKKSDQNVRGTVSLPHGTGKKVRLVVVAKGDKAKEAEAAGADTVGAEDLIERIKEGWVDFDVLVTTPDMMKDLSKLAKILGPRGLMPNPKLGTVTQDVAKAVKELKAGKIEFKADKTGNINCPVGKFSFKNESLVDNVKALIQAIVKAKPATAKGVYLRSMYLSTTMGLGLKIDLTPLATA
jgi:large subunit ribosomal protein L1